MKYDVVVIGGGESGCKVHCALLKKDAVFAL